MSRVYSRKFAGVSQVIRKKTMAQRGRVQVWREATRVISKFPGSVLDTRELVNDTGG